MEHIHIDKNGKETKVSELETEYLKNIIRYIERRASLGVAVQDGGGTCHEDFWYDEYLVFGDEALEKLNYRAYTDELFSRNK